MNTAVEIGTLVALFAAACVVVAKAIRGGKNT